MGSRSEYLAARVQAASARVARVERLQSLGVVSARAVGGVESRVPVVVVPARLGRNGADRVADDVASERAADRSARDAADQARRDAGAVGPVSVVPVSGLAALVERRMFDTGESWQVACERLADAAARGVVGAIRAAPDKRVAVDSSEAAAAADRLGCPVIVARSIAEACDAWVAQGGSRPTFYRHKREGRLAVQLTF